MATVQELEGKAFDETIRTARTPVLVNFFIPGLTACEAFVPRFSEYAELLKGKATLYAFDIVRNLHVAADYHLISSPALRLFKNGKQIAAAQGSPLALETLLSSFNRP